ncbi:MAG: hypothetical protein CBB60_000320, partial [Armatimonadetes bacterium Cent15-Ar3]
MERSNDLADQSLFTSRVFWGLTCVAVVLVCSFSNPGFLDYPNHLARFYVMTRDFQSPFFQSIYETNFRLLPNIGVDLLMFGFGRLIEPSIALRLVLGTIVWLQCSGFYKLHLARNGRIISPLVLLLPMTAVSYSFVLGFLNFSLAFGLLPWALVSVMRPRSRKWWLSLFGWSTALFFCHFFAWIIFAYLTLIWLFTQSSSKLRRSEIVTVFCLFFAFVALYKLSPSSTEESKIIWSSLSDKFKFVVATFVFGPFWKPATGLFFLLLSVLGLGRRFGISRDTKILLGATTALFLVCPMGLSIGGNFDARIPAIFFSLLLSLSTVKSSKFEQRVVVGLGCMITLIHLTACGIAMNRSNVEGARARAVLTLLPANSVVSVMSLNTGQSTHRDLWFPNYNMVQFVGVPEKPMHIQGLFSYP